MVFLIFDNLDNYEVHEWMRHTRGRRRVESVQDNSNQIGLKSLALKMITKEGSSNITIIVYFSQLFYHLLIGLLCWQLCIRRRVTNEGLRQGCVRTANLMIEDHTVFSFEQQVKSQYLYFVASIVLGLLTKITSNTLLRCRFLFV